eukprot:COSAG05_NODE_1350_length_5113_cov_5.235540_1_plen_53_part_00
MAEASSVAYYHRLRNVFGDSVFESEAPAGVKFRVGIQKSALDPDSGWIPTRV